MTKPAVVLIGADKGGVGKTVVARTLLDYFAHHRVRARAFDTEVPLTSRPSLRAAAWASPISSTTAGLPTFAKIANRRRLGTTSRSNSSFLPPVSDIWFDRPV